MSIISNLFSNFDDLTKKKSIIDNPTDCETNKNIIIKHIILQSSGAGDNHEAN